MRNARTIALITGLLLAGAARAGGGPAAPEAEPLLPYVEPERPAEAPPERDDRGVRVELPVPGEDDPDTIELRLFDPEGGQLGIYWD